MRGSAISGDLVASGSHLVHVNRCLRRGRPVYSLDRHSGGVGLSVLWWAVSVVVGCIYTQVSKVLCKI